MLVTTRFHGAVFGMLTTRPTLAICYQGKTREVLEEAGFPQFVFNFEDISAALLRSSFDELWSQREEVESRLQDHAVVVRARLQDQYDDLLRMLQGPGRSVSFERSRQRPSTAAVTS